MCMHTYSFVIIIIILHLELETIILGYNILCTVVSLSEWPHNWPSTVYKNV